MKTIKTKVTLISIAFLALLGVSVGMYKMYNQRVVYTTSSTPEQSQSEAAAQEEGVVVQGSANSEMNIIKATTTMNAAAPQPWKSFTEVIKQKRLKELTKLEFEVTQNGATEDPHTNKYDKNFEKGVYVDIVSGEPLFLSTDKFDSGTGWPSFTKTVSNSAVVLKVDNSLFSSRTEVKSRIADSHIGHVFDDGPTEKGGKRYCMNSAALRFVPLASMVAEGYSNYVSAIK